MVKTTRSRHTKKRETGMASRRRLFVRRARDVPAQLDVLRRARSRFGRLAPPVTTRSARTAIKGPGDYAVLGPQGDPRGYLVTYEDAWDLAKHGDVRADSDPTHSEPEFGVFEIDKSKEQQMKYMRRRTRKSKGGKGSPKELPMREAARLRGNLRGTKRKRSPSSSEKRQTRRRHDGHDAILAAMKNLRL